jgi:hypothetical protein
MNFCRFFRVACAGTGGDTAYCTAEDLRKKGAGEKTAGPAEVKSSTGQQLETAETLVKTTDFSEGKGGSADAGGKESGGRNFGKFGESAGETLELEIEVLAHRRYDNRK